MGALYVRSMKPRVKLDSLLHGGGQERNIRSGTLNVPGIIGFAKAVEIAVEKMEEEIFMIHNSLVLWQSMFICGCFKSKITRVFKNACENLQR